MYTYIMYIYIYIYIYTHTYDDARYGMANAASEQFA